MGEFGMIVKRGIYVVFFISLQIQMQKEQENTEKWNQEEGPGTQLMPWVWNSSSSDGGCCELYLPSNTCGPGTSQRRPEQRCQTHLHRGPRQPRGCLQRAEIIFGLYKCNYSLTVKELKLHSALWRQPWGWCDPQWNEFDTPDLEHRFSHLNPYSKSAEKVKEIFYSTLLHLLFHLRYWVYQIIKIYNMYFI